MSIQLPYQQAVFRSAIEDAEHLPRNICVDASDRSLSAKTLAGFELFATDPCRNAVIMTDPQWQTRSTEIEAFERLSGGDRFKLAVHHPTRAKIESALLKKFQKRTQASHLRNPHAEMEQALPEDISIVAANIHAGVLNATPAEGGKVVSVTTIFMSDYGAINPAAQFINLHVDFNHGDRSCLRKVEAQAGYASLIFADDALVFSAQQINSASRISIRLKQPDEKVDAWSGPEGSSVLMRVPATTLDLQVCRPTGHAPGLVRLDGDRTRWINVYDIQVK